MRSEGLQRAIAKPFARLRRGEILYHIREYDLYCSRLKQLLYRRQRFRACGRVRSLNRRGQRPLVSADSFGFLFVATGDESLTPQRALRSPFGNLRGRFLHVDGNCFVYSASFCVGNTIPHRLAHHQTLQRAVPFSGAAPFRAIFSITL